MKRYFILTSVLALAACGAGSGGGGVDGGTGVNIGRATYSTPSSVRSANSAVTQMETFSSNADEIVAKVQKAGINLSNGGSSVNNMRPSVTRSAVSADTLASAFTNQATNIQKLAMAELKNMYDIVNDGEYFNNASETQLRNAFLLAGNDADDFDASNRSGMRAEIESRYVAVLDDLVAKDGSDYLWSPKTDVLENVNFRMSGEDSYIKFTLNEEGKIVSAAKYDRDGEGYSISEEGEFTRSGTGNSFGSAKTLYEWSYAVPSNILNGVTFSDSEAATHILQDLQQKPITLDSDNAELSQADIREAILDKITERLGNLNLNADDLSAASTAIAAVVNAYTFAAPVALSAKLNINGEKLGLKYADLGFAELVVSNADGSRVLERSFTPYVGGYDSRKVEDIAQTTKFTGTAIAGVDHKETHGGQQTADGMLIRGKGVLTMNQDGTNKLVMTDFVGVDAEHKGQKWYNLTVETTNAEAVHGAPKFTVGNVKGVNEDFALNTEFNNNDKIEVGFTEDDWAGNEHVMSTGNANAGTRYGGMAEFNAYGPTKDNPTEATSSFSFSEEEHWNSNADHREVAVYGAFGGKKSN